MKVMSCADYVKLLTNRIRLLMERGVTEACVGMEVPDAVADEIFEKSEGVKQLIAWRRNGITDVYLWHDPGQPHVVLTLQFMQSFKEAATAAVSEFFL